MESNSSDEKLMKLIQNGDESAFMTLVKRYSRYFRTIAFRVVSSKISVELTSDDLDDLDQEIFLKLHESISTYDENLAKPKTWMTRITINTSIDYCRKQRRHTVLKMKLTELNYTYANPKHYEFHAKHEQNLLGKQICKLADVSLSDDEWDALYYLAHGYSQSEIAEETGIPLGTIKSRSLRALDKIRTKVN